MQRVHDGLPGRPGHRPLPGSQVRRPAGSARPPRDPPRTGHRAAVSRCLAGPDGRLLLGLRNVHDGLSGRREDRRAEQPGSSCPAVRSSAAPARLDARPDRPHRAPRRHDGAAGQLVASQPPVPGAAGPVHPDRSPGAAAALQPVGRSARGWPATGVRAGPRMPRLRIAPSSTSTVAPRTTTSRRLAGRRSTCSSGTASP